MYRRAWVIAAAAAATLVLLGYLVNGNIRYQVGVGRVSGYSVAETFSHRPIAFRLLSAAQSWLPEQVSALAGPAGSWWRVWAFEAGFRLVAAGLAAGAALALWAGLRRRLGSRAWPYGVAAYTGLAFTAPATGEPDWWAALLAVAAVGVGLLARPWLGGVLGGALLALVALVKISSLTVALAALVLLWALDRRRGWIAAVAALVTGLLAVGLIWWLAPWEIDWLLDIRALQPDPWTRVAADEAGHYLLNLAARWPTVALLPAFFVGATRAEVWPTLVAMALTGLAIAYQGQYFIYHSAALVVLSAVLAVRTIQRSGGALRWPLLVLCGWTLVLFILPAAWRVQHPTRLYLATLGWTIGLVVWQWRALRRPPALPSGQSDWWAAALVTAAMLATQTPISAESANLGTAGRTSWASASALQRELAEADVIRDVIGADSQVVYLAFGATTYLIGNPTRCRFPSPLFLQRPHADEKVSSATRQENLGCLEDPAARWLIWDRNWLHRKGAPEDLLATIDRIWDCDRAQLIGGYTICPRRL